MIEYKKYDIVIVGGGVSGTALFYALSKYSNVKSIAIIEKYNSFGQVNSKGNNNSQTLHIGDIETNYAFEKASLVKPAAMMILKYINSLKQENTISFPVSKMILAVGHDEVSQLEQRYKKFKKLFPDLRRIEFDEISKIEPAITKDRDSKKPILALYTEKGYAIDYESLAKSFAKEAVKDTNPKREIDIFLNTKVLKIKKNTNGKYIIETKDKIFEADSVVVNADSYSLYFAKMLGYGKEFSLIPVAGNFYFSKQLLNGKVYTMQDKKLPFAAVHGDPDIHIPNKTRWGPTAKMSPVLESRKFSTSLDYFRSASLFRFRTIKSFLKILSDMTRFIFLLKNTLYDIPIIGKYFFIKNVQKIVPSIRAKDLKKAKGYGGMRLQRVDTNTSELKLGEGKIIGKNIIFNMTPSPGASVSLFNGMRDAENLMKFFNGKYHFDKCAMENDFGAGCFDHDNKSISDDMYVS